MTSIAGSPKGTITMTYKVSKPVTVKDPDTGEEETKPGEPEERKIIREVEFVKEDQ